MRRLPEAELLKLGPHARDASLALLGAAPDAEAIARVAGGNPLFLRELARAGGTALPATLLAAVRRETTGIGGAPARLLAGAACGTDSRDQAPVGGAAARGGVRRLVSEVVQRAAMRECVRSARMAHVDVFGEELRRVSQRACELLRGGRHGVTDAAQRAVRRRVRKADAYDRGHVAVVWVIGRGGGIADELGLVFDHAVRRGGGRGR